MVLVAALGIFDERAFAEAGSPRTTASVEPLHEAPEDRLARGRQAYLRNDFPGAIAAVRELLYPDVQLNSAEDVQAAHRVLALAYLFAHDEKQAEQEFNALLQLRPDFNLDPVFDPPAAISFLESLKQREDERVQAMERLRREEAERAAREEERRRKEDEDRIRRSLKPVVIERVFEKHHLVLAFLPFGVGQFQNGENAKGTVFLTTQLSTAAISLAFWAGLEIKYNGGATKYPPSDFGMATVAQYTAVIAGALFWGDVVVGIVDALVNYRAEVLRSTSTKQISDAGDVRPIPRRETPTFSSLRLGIAPLVAGTRAGDPVGGDNGVELLLKGSF